MSVMRACKTHRVKRCVVTSSGSAIVNVAKTDAPEDNLYDETFWSNLDRPEGGVSDYTKSKTLSEKAAWNFVGLHPHENPFELVTLNPVFIMGPSIASDSFMSVVNRGQFIKSFITGSRLKTFVTGSRPKLSKTSVAYVDVRDVALAHVKAIKVEKAANKRFILNAGELWYREVAAILQEELGSKGYNVTREEDPEGVVSRQCRYQNQLSKDVLGIEYRPLKDTFADMVESMI